VRDPNRIIPILDAIREIWEKDPDLRLGQLLFNLMRATRPDPDVFSFEDDMLMKRLKRVAEVGWAEFFREARVNRLS
jgi:uncharacterized protein YihD (DUF1040 family)